MAYNQTVMAKFTDQIKLAETLTVRVKVHDKSALRTDDKHVCAWPGCKYRVVALIQERVPTCEEHKRQILRLVLAE